MNKKKLSTAIIIPLAIILLATTVWAARAVTITPTDPIDSTICATYMDQNFVITGTGFTRDTNVHFKINGMDINNGKRSACGESGCSIVSDSNGIRNYFDGNILVSATGGFTVDLNFTDDLTPGTYDINVSDANAWTSAANVDWVDTTIYLRPIFKQTEFVVSDNVTVSVCKSIASVPNLRLDANNNYVQFTQAITGLNIKGTIDFDSNIALTGKAIQIDARSGHLSQLVNKTANIHFNDLTSQNLYEGKIELYWTPSGITTSQLCSGSQCTDITYGNQKADFKVLNFSGDDTYELVVAGGKPHGKLIQLPPSGIPGLSIVGDAFGNKYVVSVFVIIALFGVFIVGSRLLKRR